MYLLLRNAMLTPILQMPQPKHHSAPPKAAVGENCANSMNLFYNLIKIDADFVLLVKTPSFEARNGN